MLVGRDMDDLLRPIRLPPVSGDRPWSGDPVLGPAPRFDREASRRFCRRLVRRHAENFPVFAAWMRPGQRAALAAVYAFARTADDFADEPEFEGRRERLLDVWEEALVRAFAGRAVHPVFVALAEASAAFRLPPQPFHDLLSAFRQDVRGGGYARFDELLDYCRRSANPVGRLVLRILGADGPRERAASDRICTALQLTNFWQDLSVDLPRNRLYLPREDLERFRLRPAELRARTAGPAAARLLAFEIDRTAAIFSEGAPLVARAGWPAGAYLAAVWAGGRSVLALAAAAGVGLLRERPALDGRGLAALARAAARGGRRRAA